MHDDSTGRTAGVRALGMCFLLLPASATMLAQQPAVTAPAAPKPVMQSVTVVAQRGLSVADSATSTVTLLPEQMQAAPGLTLDDQLHQVAGFGLFRRTSSWTANPTTEGVSLRGLGSTAASRTLVVSDQVPMNDPFGGWVHWNEVPTQTIGGVNLLRGGSSDLYGSSAIGGVIDVVPVTPLPAGASSHRTAVGFSADASGATSNSANENAALTVSRGRLGALGAISGFSTGGYIPIAPAIRGAVDIPANVKGETARIELRAADKATGNDIFLRGNLLNEVRSNGTPLQTNAARLWRYQAGGDLHTEHTQSLLRLFGSREGYRQSFTSVPAGRNTETLTKLQRVPSDELGLALQTSRTFSPQLIAALGFDVRDIRGTDNEKTPSTGVTTSTSAHQREIGGFADALWQPGSWLISASIRVDSFRTFDARQVLSSTGVVTALPQRDELFAGPHIGIVRKLGANAALTANAFRAFRGPTLNELYRTSQVGSQTTLANNSLLAERATGFEFGGNTAIARVMTVRASYFWTEVNRPITAIQISQTPPPPAQPTSVQLQRQNIGQIRSQGLSLDTEVHPVHNFSATVQYQLAFATVTKFVPATPQQPSLLGNWIPEVPRQAVTATANYSAQRFANFHVIASYTGQAYDDAANGALLHPYARFDVSADRSLGHGLSIFGGAQNLLNRAIEAGRTPQLTLAAPRLVQAGLRFTFKG